MAYWLMKSEAATYGWADLLRDGGTDWDGVRNNAARLHLRAMKPGDQAFLYHSMAEKAVVGIMEIIGPGEPDGADGEWVKVPVKPVRALAKPVTLAAIKAEPRLAKSAHPQSRPRCTGPRRMASIARHGRRVSGGRCHGRP